MNNSNTYNASFVFMSNKVEVVYTIVCNSSDEEINRDLVNNAIHQAFMEHEGKPVHPEFVIREAVSRIVNDCGYNAVFVRSDINYLIPKK